MKNHCAVTVIVVLMFVLGACSSPSIVNEETPAPTDIPQPTAAPAETATISPTSTAEIQESEESYGPNGIITFDTESEFVRLSSRDGSVIDEWQFPGFSYSPQLGNKFHFGGLVEDGLIAAPCIFHSYLNQEPHIAYHEDKALVSLRKISQLINMVGAPGQPLVAYSFLAADSLQSFNENRYQAPSDETTKEPEYVHSWLFAGSPTSLADAQAIISRADENGLVIHPLAVKTEADELVGVWYTLEPKGTVGIGPIFFMGFSRLYYADLQTGLIDEVLGAGFGTLALSPDQTTVAYENSGMNDQPIVTIHNLVDGKIQFIDVLPDTHPTGVGDAHFSPSGKHLAWREVGMGKEALFSIIRIASTTEDTLSSKDTLFELDTREIASQLDDKGIHWILIAGWLGDETLLLEVGFDEGTDLYGVNIDGSELEYLTTGKFLGLVYP